jgi:hypothetical protein
MTEVGGERTKKCKGAKEEYSRRKKGWKKYRKKLKRKQVGKKKSASWAEGQVCVCLSRFINTEGHEG